jgi:hypothetical protein
VLGTRRIGHHRPMAAVAPNPKTVRLARGKHVSPERGACVLELASMLEGGPFTDRPASVSPVVGALLRSYNDTVGEVRRQELYGYAAAVLGSRGSTALERARMTHLLDALEAAHKARPAWRRLLGGSPRLQLPLGPSELEVAAMALVRLHERRGGRGSALAVVDELLAMQEPVAMAPPALRPEAARRAPAPA